MIDHKHKCIFVHVPRTAGTSVEQWIVGQDWWLIEPSTKHLLASQAKRIYADYWDDYFKFSFVRDPVDRVISCLKYSSFFGATLDQHGGVDFNGYHSLFGDKKIIEFDYRFHERAQVIRDNHYENYVYGNIIDEKLDFIGKYENLTEDANYIASVIGITSDFNVHIEKSQSRISTKDLSNEAINHVKIMYYKDYEMHYADLL